MDLQLICEPRSSHSLNMSLLIFIYFLITITLAAWKASTCCCARWWRYFLVCFPSPGGQGGLWMNGIVTWEAKDLNPCQQSMVPRFNPDYHVALTSHSRVNTCPPIMKQLPKHELLSCIMHTECVCVCVKVVIQTTAWCWWYIKQKQWLGEY